jgi:transposase
VHLDDGGAIDNNDTEQLMQVALGRKNWMFIGSIDAGNRAADLLSIVSSAARNDLDIFVYVKDVASQRELRSDDVWKLAHPEAVRSVPIKSAKRAPR